MEFLKSLPTPEGIRVVSCTEESLRVGTGGQHFNSFVLMNEEAVVS